jgi:NAD(P)-dependent dehydrogenase (short-subunit alcohol dehydrogenase family)
VIRFDDQVVLVTGAGRGLGAAYARAFAERGAAVVVHDAGLSLDGAGGDRAIADAVAKEIGGLASYEDLRSEAGCRHLVEQTLHAFGRLDAVVHNAGLLVFEKLDDAERNWDAVLSTSIDAAFHITRAAWGPMQDQGYGRFVFTTSSRAMWLKDALVGAAAYCTGKMGAVGLMLVTAAEGAEHGIKANAIAPVAETRMLQRKVQPGELAPKLVAPGVVYLASDRCEVNGIVVQAAGGTFNTVAWQRGAEIECATPEELADELEGVVRTT